MSLEDGAEGRSTEETWGASWDAISLDDPGSDVH